MSVGRVLSSLTASLAVAGCAAVVIGMSGGESEPAADRSATPVASPARTTRPAHLATSSAATTSVTAAPTHDVATTSGRASSTSAVVTTTAAAKRPTTAPASTSRVLAAPPRTSTAARAKAAPKPPAAVKRAAPKGHKLPLPYSTGSATRVITVVASSHSRTTAKLQAWTKVSGGWRKYGSAVTAHVGADGMSKAASETRSKTPIGSFTLTRAFGYRSDPGTALPYRRTTPSDWWISQPGRLYNTHQRCSSHCGFTRGSPNEHLYYETPYYNYAVVIDYNTRNAPGGVRQGKGSAFFLHVTDGRATAGCVAIPQSNLKSIMRWLKPSAHPRILIGVT